MRNIKFSKTLVQALSIAIDRNLPFALYYMPGQSKPVFFASKHVVHAKSELMSGSNQWSGFIIDFFHPRSSFPIAIPAQFSANDLIRLKNELKPQDTHSPRPQFITTSPALYMAQVEKFVSELKREETSLKKAVLCRMVSAMGRPVIEVAQDYFSAFPNTFRYLYYTPDSGMWIGASPELLLDCDFNYNIVSTMSLAGTKQIDSDEKWSKKNIREHNIVTDYIVSAMQHLGLAPQVSELHERQFGNVVHLCNDISATYNGVDISKLLRTLSPTPALCGWPKQQAMQLIESTETFERLCYGGWIAAKDSTGLHAFVNLRCASVCVTFDSLYHYCIYTGGGIMPDSNYKEEWEETANKAFALCSIVALPGDTQCVDDLTNFYLTINPEFSCHR